LRSAGGGVAGVLAPAMLATAARAADAETDPAAGPAEGLLVALARGVQERAERLGAAADATGEALRELPLHAFEVLRNLTDQAGWPAVGYGLVVLAAMLAAGFAAERGVLRIAADARRRLALVAADNPATRLAVLTARLAVALLGLAVFAAAALGLSFAFFPRYDPMRVAVGTYALAVVVVRAAVVACRLLLRPDTEENRLLPCSAATAHRTQTWVLSLTAVAAFGFSTAGLLQLLGLPEPLFRPWSVAVGTVLAALLAAIVLRHRQAVAAALAAPAGDAGGGRSVLAGRDLVSALAAAWHLFALAYLAAVWLAWAGMTFTGGGEAAAERAAASLAAALAIPAVDGLFHLLLAGRSEAAERPAAEQRPGRDRLLRLLRAALRGALAALALVLLVDAWGGSVIAWLTTPSGSAVGRAALDILFALLLAYGAWELVKAWIERRLRGTASGATAHAVHSRAATLLPLLRSTVLAVLVATVTMIVLSSLGVDIGPLLAGAGVVGIAIGLGAQTLVRDIVAGAFFLIDDAFRVGEYIEIDDNLKGTVERISLRSMQLRHHRGPLQTLPFGELKSIVNHGRDWVIYKQEFPVPYETDLGKTKRIIKEVGAELMTHPELGAKFLEPLKSQGIHRVADSAFVLRTKFKCLPGEQFEIRRAVFERVTAAFAEAGLALAQTTVTIQIPPGAPPQDAGLAAAGLTGLHPTEYGAAKRKAG
jgi:small-conductance mechanosensitive channel